jgi:RHS repeat-associated protein
VCGTPNTSIKNTVLFASMDLDPATGLYNDVARWYNYALGTFVTTDPILYQGGFNFYEYAVDNSANALDPTGNIEWRATNADVIAGEKKMQGAKSPSGKKLIADIEKFETQFNIPVWVIDEEQYLEGLLSHMNPAQKARYDHLTPGAKKKFLQEHQLKSTFIPDMDNCSHCTVVINEHEFKRGDPSQVWYNTGPNPPDVRLATDVTEGLFYELFHALHYFQRNKHNPPNEEDLTVKDVNDTYNVDFHVPKRHTFETTEAQNETAQKMLRKQNQNLQH